jgi:hypothetical protein
MEARLTNANELTPCRTRRRDCNRKNFPAEHAVLSFLMLSVRAIAGRFITRGPLFLSRQQARPLYIVRRKYGLDDLA